MRRVGKSTRARERASWQRELSAFWSQNPITVCEVKFPGCLRTFGLSPAHSKKRRFIDTKADYFAVCAACLNCHRILDEKMTHEEMERTVLEIIRKRGFDALNPKGH